MNKISLTIHYCQDALQLNDACTLLPQNMLGLVYTPHHSGFVHYREGQLIGENEHPISMQSVYEVRFFSPDFEMRWLHKDAGKGQVVCLGKVPATIQAWPTETLADLTAIPNRYLLWGQQSNKHSYKPGWSLLAEARIGRLPVPLENLSVNSSVHLHTCEYIGMAPGLAGAHGNRAVVEECWIELKESRQ